MNDYSIKRRLLHWTYYLAVMLFICCSKCSTEWGNIYVLGFRGWESEEEEDEIQEQGQQEDPEERSTMHPQGSAVSRRVFLFEPKPKLALWTGLQEEFWVLLQPPRWTGCIWRKTCFLFLKPFFFNGKCEFHHSETRDEFLIILPND